MVWSSTALAEDPNRYDLQALQNVDVMISLEWKERPLPLVVRGCLCLPNQCMPFPDEIWIDS
jgi:hypothetical protein